MYKASCTLGRNVCKEYQRAMSDFVYRLMEQQSWLHTKCDGVFEGSADDCRDGYIHFSTAKTVRETARRYYADIPALMLLSVQAKDLGAALKWEPARGGELFPHLYAPLNMAHVFDAKLLPYKDGTHQFGPDIP
jgi:uncharacterized protein (DUF952 family)